MYQDRRNIPSAVTNPAPPDPYSEPKLLGSCAFLGALMAGILTIPIAFLVRAPVVAISIIAAMWSMLFLFQLFGWHNYFFRIRPAQQRAALAKVAAEVAQAKLADLRARNAAKQEALQAALADYKQAAEEGQEAMKRLWDRAENPTDKKRVLRAWEDYRRVQKKFDDEPDLAMKMSLQAEAMRREIRHIDLIQFSF